MAFSNLGYGRIEFVNIVFVIYVKFIECKRV